MRLPVKGSRFVEQFKMKWDRSLAVYFLRQGGSHAHGDVLDGSVMTLV